MAVRLEMLVRRSVHVASLAAFFSLLELVPADAQTAPASGPTPITQAPQVSPPPAPQSPAPPAVAPAPQAPAAAPPAGFAPAPSPLIAPPPAANAQPGVAPQAPPQAPVYPSPYAQAPAPPGYYGSYPPPAGYGRPYEPEPVARPGARRHDGFFLRFKLGVGAGGTFYDERVEEPRRSAISTRGIAGNFELAVGGAVIENLILHGNIIVTAMGVSRWVDDVKDHTYDEISSTILIAGGGVTYYFMPANLYLTLVLGSGGIFESRYLDRRDRSPYEELESRAGFGTNLSLGKEWWVGRYSEWGLGAAITGAFVAAPLRIGELSTTYYGHNVTLNFSATFN